MYPAERKQVCQEHGKGQKTWQRKNAQLPGTALRNMWAAEREVSYGGCFIYKDSMRER